MNQLSARGKIVIVAILVALLGGVVLYEAATGRPQLTWWSGVDPVTLEWKGSTESPGGGVTGTVDVTITAPPIILNGTWGLSNARFTINSVQVFVDGNVMEVNSSIWPLSLCTDFAITTYSGASAPAVSCNWTQLNMPSSLMLPAMLSISFAGVICQPAASETLSYPLGCSSGYTSTVTVNVDGTWMSLHGLERLHLTLVSEPIHWGYE